MKQEKNYPFLMIEVFTDTDKSSETYKEKYITVTCVPFKNGRADNENITTIKADRFTIEHHTLKGKIQTFRSQDYES